MRRGGAILGLVLVVLIVIGFVNYRYDWPVRVFGSPQEAVVTPQGNGAYVARYSNARGLQDAPRADVAQGEVIDMQHCLNTMNLRGLKPDVAQHTCTQLIAGISH